MKKILLTIIWLALASPAWSAQTAVTEISGVQPSVGALKTQVNAKLGTVESNRQDHETRVAAMETGKADKTSFASQAAFTSTWGWTPGGGSFDQAGNYTLTGSWNFSEATVSGLSGGSMIYPDAGIPASTGSAWGTSYSVGTSANNLVQLNSSAQLPAVSAALLTNFPTLNQNTTGTAAGLSDQYIDWNATSGGASIKNKPETTTITSSIITGLFTGSSGALCKNGTAGDCGLSTGGGYTNLTEYVDQTAWRLFYSDGSGDVQELALGASGTVLKSNGAGAAPSFQAEAGSGGVATEVTTAPYSNVACTGPVYDTVANRYYPCIDGYHVAYLSGTAFSNAAPTTSTPSFSWNGDHASGSLYAAISGGTLLGSKSGAASIVSGGSDPGTASPDGSNVLKSVSGSESNITFIRSTIADIQSGYFEEYVYFPAINSYATLLDVYSSGAGDYNRISVWANGTVHFSNSSTSVSFASTNAVTSAGWVLVSVKWSVSEIGIKIGSNAWEYKGSGFDTAQTGCQYIYLGMDGAYNGMTYYTDGAKIWTTYDQQ